MDKITGLDLVMDCDAYDEFADYCEQSLATTARNFDILNRNIDILQRNITIAIRNYRLDEVCKNLEDDVEKLSGMELVKINNLRAVNLDDFDSLRARVEQFKNGLAIINRTSQKEIENSIDRLGMFQDLFNSNIRYINLKSYSSESFEELEEFEEFPVEPEPPKW